MQIPPQLTSACWGAVAGAAALAIVGFGWGGWITGATADQRAQQLSKSALVAALAPICAERFRQQTNAGENLAELKKVASWQQGSYIEKGGWATMPGSTSADAAVASACADILRQQAK